MGANLFIWIAIAVVVVSTILGLNGHGGWAGLGYAAAVVLAIGNKVRITRLRRKGVLPAVIPEAARAVPNLAVGLLIGALIGLIFFGTLVVLMISGLREP